MGDIREQQCFIKVSAFFQIRSYCNYYNKNLTHTYNLQ